MKNTQINVIASRHRRRGNLKSLDRFVITFLAMTIIPSSAMAETINVSVNGLVCSFCAVAIEKTFAKKGVEKVDVNLDEKYVHFTLPNEVKMTDAEITETINDAGYDVVEIERKN